MDPALLLFPPSPSPDGLSMQCNVDDVLHRRMCTIYFLFHPVALGMHVLRISQGGANRCGRFEEGPELVCM